MYRKTPEAKNRYKLPESQTNFLLELLERPYADSGDADSDNMESLMSRSMRSRRNSHFSAASSHRQGEQEKMDEAQQSRRRSHSSNMSPRTGADALNLRIANQSNLLVPLGLVGASKAS